MTSAFAKPMLMKLGAVEHEPVASAASLQRGGKTHLFTCSGSNPCTLTSSTLSCTGGALCAAAVVVVAVDPLPTAFFALAFAAPSGVAYTCVQYRAVSSNPALSDR